MRQKKNIVSMPIDKIYHLEIDHSNWTVVKTNVNKTEGHKHFGKTYETTVGYYHDLGKAVLGVAQDMTRDGEADTKSMSIYLSWHEATVHSIGDRILRQKEALKEALELNKVM